MDTNLAGLAQGLHETLAPHPRADWRSNEDRYYAAPGFDWPTLVPLRALLAIVGHAANAFRRNHPVATA